MAYIIGKGTGTWIAKISEIRCWTEELLTSLNKFIRPIIIGLDAIFPHVKHIINVYDMYEISTYKYKEGRKEDLGLIM